MKTYKATNGTITYSNNFVDLESAEVAFSSLINQGYIVSLADINEQIPPITPEQRLESDLQFGNQLVKEFLKDNRLITPIVTPSESLQLLSEFNNIEKLANLGDIKSVSILLNGIQTDPRLFTQERKDKYMSMINSYLQN